MTPSTSGLPVPHARLSGTWQVLRETDDGRPTVALRGDDGAGVALAYPGEAGGAVAALVNAEAGFVLLTGRFRSSAPVEDLATGRRPTGWIAASELESLGRTRIASTLSNGRLLRVVPDDGSGNHGAIQLFDDPGSAREAWGSPFPALRERMLAVQRLLAGMDLREVARRMGADRAGTP